MELVPRNKRLETYTVYRMVRSRACFEHPQFSLMLLLLAQLMFQAVENTTTYLGPRLAERIQGSKQHDPPHPPRSQSHSLRFTASRPFTENPPKLESKQKGRDEGVLVTKCNRLQALDKIPTSFRSAFGSWPHKTAPTFDMLLSLGYVAARASFWVPASSIIT